METFGNSFEFGVNLHTRKFFSLNDKQFNLGHSPSFNVKSDVRKIQTVSGMVGTMARHHRLVIIK